MCVESPGALKDPVQRDRRGIFSSRVALRVDKVQPAAPCAISTVRMPPAPDTEKRLENRQTPNEALQLPVNRQTITDAQI